MFKHRQAALAFLMELCYHHFMTKSEAEASKKRCVAATEGPWWWQDWFTYGDPNEGLNRQTLVSSKKDPESSTENYLVSFEEAPESAADTEFIAHARLDLPCALEMLEKAMFALGQLRDFEVPAAKANGDQLLRRWEGRV